MAQNTFVDGDVLTASDINTYLMGEGGAWTSWTPVVVQSGSVTVTNVRSRYARYGRTIHFSVNVLVTGSGTGSNKVTVTLPVTAAAETAVGVGRLTDASAGLWYPFIAELDSATTLAMVSPGSTTANYLGALDFTAGLASGDTIAVSGTYEAAS